MGILAVINQKGGCGKTTTAINLAAALASTRKRILLVDLDPQGHCGLGLGVHKDHLEYSMADVMDKRIELKKIIRKVDQHFYLAPANIYLAGFEHRFSGQSERESQLKQRLDPYIKEYDFIIIDCPPNLGLLTINAMVASQAMIVPLELSAFSLDGVARLQHIVDFLSKHLEFKSEHRLLVTMDDRSRLSKKLIRQLEVDFPNKLLRSTIRKNVSLKEAALQGQHVLAYDPVSFGARDHQALAHEVLDWQSYPALPKLTQVHTPPVEFREICLKFYDPRAQQVKVAGDFNNWNASHAYQLMSLQNGHFATVIPLKHGSYRYRFIVDGQWIEDPSNPHKAVNTYGSFDSILTVNTP